MRLALQADQTPQLQKAGCVPGVIGTNRILANGQGTLANENKRIESSLIAKCASPCTFQKNAHNGEIGKCACDKLQNAHNVSCKIRTFLAREIAAL